MGEKNYLGDTIIRDQYGNQVGTIGEKNYLGDVPIRDNFGNIIGKFTNGG